MKGTLKRLTHLYLNDFNTERRPVKNFVAELKSRISMEEQESIALLLE